MDVIETLAKVVLVWTTLSLVMAVVWARFMGRVARMEAALAAERSVRLSAAQSASCSSMARVNVAARRAIWSVPNSSSIC